MKKTDGHNSVDGVMLTTYGLILPCEDFVEIRFQYNPICLEQPGTLTRTRTRTRTHAKLGSEGNGCLVTRRLQVEVELSLLKRGVAVVWRIVCKGTTLSGRSIAG